MKNQARRHRRGNTGFRSPSRLLGAAIYKLQEIRPYVPKKKK